MKKEIDIFKEEIALSDFILDNGGILDKEKSCKNYDVVEFNGDKLIINKGKNGHYTFFNSANGQGGTIVDFYKNYIKDEQFGKIMGQLRKYKNNKKEYTFTKQIDTKNTLETLKEIDKLKTEINPTYLEDFRKISKETFLVFKDKIRQDNNNNICFVHSHYRLIDNKIDIESCGIEKKNKDYKGHFGEKGIWGKEIGNTQEMHIFESPFDAMAFYELHKKEGIYISTGGNLSEEGIKDIINVAQYKNIEKINYCFDADEGGQRLKERLEEIIKIALPTVQQKQEKSQKKDFNDDLKAQKQEKQKPEEEIEIDASGFYTTRRRMR